jgi:hypothetical protein
MLISWAGKVTLQSIAAYYLVHVDFGSIKYLPLNVSMASGCYNASVSTCSFPQSRETKHFSMMILGLLHGLKFGWGRY